MSVPSNDMTVPAVVASGDPAAGSPQRSARRPQVAVLPTLLISLGSGIAVGVAWVVLAPVLADWAGANEATAARDVAFGLLGVLAGLITAAVLLVWPGSRPAVHTAVVLVAACAASTLAWGVGELLGAQRLHAVALIVVWPLVASAVTVLRSLIWVMFTPS